MTEAVKGTGVWRVLFPASLSGLAVKKAWAKAYSKLGKQMESSGTSWFDDCPRYETACVEAASHWEFKVYPVGEDEWAEFARKFEAQAIEPGALTEVKRLIKRVLRQKALPSRSERKHFFRNVGIDFLFEWKADRNL